ncbi:MAG: hypothetical protein U1F31_15705 [Steroidobacteraceae bacterium]
MLQAYLERLEPRPRGLTDGRHTVWISCVREFSASRKSIENVSIV